MTTINGRLTNNHEAIMAQLKSLHEKSKEAIGSASAHAHAQISAGDTQEAVHTMNGLMDAIEHKNTVMGNAMQQRAATARKMMEMPIPSGGSKASLPKGITTGKTAAIVAGIGLLAAGTMLYRHAHRQKQQSGSWAQRVEQERTQPQRGPAL